MSLLKKENWIVDLLLTILTDGLLNIVLGYFLKVYDKNAWYSKWYYWVIACIPCFIPAFIMLCVFMIQIGVKVASKLEVPGEEIYKLPYFWILCLIIPVIGWILFIVMNIYITIWPVVMIKKGNGEKYI